MPFGMSMAIPEFAVPASSSSNSSSSGEGRGLERFGTGKLVYSPLFESGVAVPTRGVDRTALRKRCSAYFGTIVSEFSSTTSPAPVSPRARLIAPTKPRLCALVSSRMRSSAANSPSRCLMAGSGEASSTTTMVEPGVQATAVNALSMQARVAARSR